MIDAAEPKATRASTFLRESAVASMSLGPGSILAGRYMLLERLG